MQGKPECKGVHLDPAAARRNDPELVRGYQARIEDGARCRADDSTVPPQGQARIDDDQQVKRYEGTINPSRAGHEHRRQKKVSRNLQIDLEAEIPAVLP